MAKGAGVKLCKAGLLLKIKQRVFASFPTLHQALAKLLQHFNSTYGDAIEYIQILLFKTFAVRKTFRTMFTSGSV